MSRSTVIITIAVVVMLALTINAAIPHANDSRRHSLGELDSIDMGSIRLPCGWYLERRKVLDDKIKQKFSGPVYRCAVVEIVIHREPASDVELEQIPQRAFVTGEFSNGQMFFDPSRQLMWSQSRFTAKGEKKHVITARFLAPRDMTMTFTDLEDTPRYEVTTTRVVDSFGLIPVDPSTSDRDQTGDLDWSTLTYAMADVDRRRHAYWLVGACLVLIGLVYADMSMDKKEAEQDELERRAERRDAIRARLAGEATPADELEHKTDHAMAKIDDRQRENALDFSRKTSGDADDDAAERLIQESRDARGRNRGTGDNDSIPFD